MSDVVAGVAWAADAAYEKAELKAQGKAPKHKGSVANMSLGGGKSQALDDAVNSAVDDGLHFAVAVRLDIRLASSGVLVADCFSLNRPETTTRVSFASPPSTFATSLAAPPRSSKPALLTSTLFADACAYSPASAENAITVAASTIADERAYFSVSSPPSNFDLVDLLADQPSSCITTELGQVH